MQLTAKNIFPIAISMCLFILSCTKYKDPSPPKLELENKYCNDPLAINFNHGFPGTPDSSICIYPTEPFLGIWTLVDSVFTSELTFISTNTYTIQINASNSPSDSLKNQMTMSGLCINGNYLQLRANRNMLALTDTLIQYSNGGQIFCTSTDTISGSFKVIQDSTGTRMQVNLNENKSDGQYLHFGKATQL